MSLKMRALALYGSVSSPINNLWLNVCLSDWLASTAGYYDVRFHCISRGSGPIKPRLIQPGPCQKVSQVIYIINLYIQLCNFVHCV